MHRESALPHNQHKNLLPILQLGVSLPGPRPSPRHMKVQMDMAVTRVAVRTKIQMQPEKQPMKGFQSAYMELRWIRRRSTQTSQIGRKLLSPAIRPPFPIYISTDPKHIDLHQLQQLYATCNHSCHRFPNYVESHGSVESVDVHKLRVALSHSAVLVSVFCKSHHIVDDGGDGDFTSLADSSKTVMGMADFLQSVTPVSPFDGQLVGFGRAISDCGLTASIYDVMVTIPDFPLIKHGYGEIN